MPVSEIWTKIVTTSEAPPKKERKIRRATCSECGGERNCSIYGHRRVSETFEHVTGWTDWYLLQCRGCDYIFCQKVLGNSEDWYFAGEPGDYSEIEHNETVSYFPSISSRKRPEWMSDYGIDIPGATKLDDSLIELYQSLDAGLHRLAGIGVRTCFEVASVELGAEDHLSFEDKLKKLVGLGHISLSDKAHINLMIEAGNASAHRGWRPDAQQLDTLMDVLENIIYHAFILPARRKELDKKMKEMDEQVPKREKKKKS